MKPLYSLVVSLFLITPLLVQASPTAAEYGVVLNLSGKQRMLSQKMSKEVALVALGVEKSQNIQNLKNTADLFNKTLKGLKEGSSELGLPPTESKRILRQLGKVEEIWADFYPTIQQITSSGQATPEQLKVIFSQNLPLLKQMNKAVGLYEKDAKKSGLESAPGLAATINLAGKQRMLTQKMSKEYLLIALRYEVEENKLNLLETYSLFDRTLKGLVHGDQTLGLPGTQQPHIQAQLKIVDDLWQSFKPLVSEGAHYKTNAIPQEKLKQLADSNLPLLTEMNKAVGLYEKEASK